MPNTLNIYQRMHHIMQECSYVQKDTEVKGFGGGYSAVSHDAVTAKVRGYFLKHRVMPVANVVDSRQHSETVQRKNGPALVYRCEVTVETTFVNIDDPTDRYSICTVGTGEDSGDKAPGKAMSYAVKYGVLKGLFLETGDDADHDASIESAPYVPPHAKLVAHFEPLGVNLEQLETYAMCDRASWTEEHLDLLKRVGKAMKSGQSWEEATAASA